MAFQSIDVFLQIDLEPSGKVHIKVELNGSASEGKFGADAGQCTISISVSLFWGIVRQLKKCPSSFIEYDDTS